MGACSRNWLTLGRSFSHDPHSRLTGVLAVALVCVERCPHLRFCIILDRLMRTELHIARFADADGNWGTLYDPEIAFWHG